jgi:probable HAF family extracellular repeat protein
VGYNSGAVLWQNGAFTSLGAGANSDAYAVNDAGHVVGYGTFGGSTYTHAFSWTATQGFTDLGTLPSRLYSRAADLNAAGQVVGVSNQLGGSTYLNGGLAFLWDSTNGMQDLGTSSLWISSQNSSTATAINSTGQIVGYSLFSGFGPGSTTYAMNDSAYFRDSSGAMMLLGSLPNWMYSRALDINDLGQVVGSSGDFQVLPHFVEYRPQQAALWQNGVTTGLGVPAGYSRTEAVSINNAGQVICIADPGNAPGYSGRVFLWDHGMWTDLGYSTSTVTADINDRGQIMIGSWGGSPTDSLLLTPTPPQIQSLQINDGSAQRSEVTSLRVAFDRHVALPINSASAFQLKRQNDSAMVTLAAAVDNSGSGTVVTLTFTGGPVNGASLADGRYTLTVLAAQVAGGSLDGNGDGTGGDNYVMIGDPATNKLFRIFGDADGDGTVAASDFIVFRQVFGGYLFAFDFDGDGSVAASDFIQFRLRFGGSI